MHFSAGSREEAASWVIQSAHSEAHTETHEPEREMKVEPEKLERREKMGTRQKQMKVKKHFSRMNS